MSNYQQTDTSYVASESCLGADHGGIKNLRIQSGAAAGTISLSSTTLSGGSLRTVARFSAIDGDPGTATWLGATTCRFNITTANTNITWASIYWCAREDADNGVIVTATTTSGLAIGLGTTGVKTASVELTIALAISLSAAPVLEFQVSNAAAMASVFNWISNQIITMPFTASAAPAASAVFTLAQMKVGS